MAAKDLRTVFVRGVSFDADEKDLEELFSDVGPVKQCFLVRVKGQAKHRGFGFVQYALPEDAERAVHECNGKSLKGRKLQVEVADKRAPLEERNKKRKLTQDGAPADGGGGGSAAAGATDPEQPATKAQPAPTSAAAASRKPAAAAQPSAEGEGAAVPAAPARKRQRADAGAGTADAVAVAAEKHKLLRAVAIGNLVPAAVSQAITLARKAAPVEEVLNPAPADIVKQAKLEADGCSGGVIIVIYKTVKDAMHAVTQLHNHTLELHTKPVGGGGKKGRKGAAKKRGTEGEEADGAEADGQDPPDAQRISLWAREVKGEGAHVKQWRVILRNLPFKITEAALVKALQPVGFVWELKLPRGPDGRLKGFAFAAFTCRAHAEKAIASLNGKELMGRLVVVDWAVSKTQYLQGGAAAAGEAAGGRQETSEDPDRPASGSEEEGEESGGEGDEGEDEDEDDDEEDEEDGEEDETEEEIGLSSDEEGAEILDSEEEDEDEEGEDEEELEEDEDEEEEELEEDDEEVVEGDAGDEDEEAQRERGMLSDVLRAVLDEHEQSQGLQAAKAAVGGEAKQQPPREKQQPDKKPQPQQPQERKRQAWQGEEVEDPDAAAAAGDGPESRQRPASTSAKSSSLSTTVFVRGLPLDVTSAGLQARLEVFGPVKACRLVMDKASGKPKGTAFVEFKEEEAAAKAAAACARGRRNEGPGITLSGRPLDVDLAVSGEEARSIATQRVASKVASKDRRNLYLAKEGHITEGSPAWSGMSAHDQAKRKRAAEEKNQKLKSPNFVISRTRLSVRNIPPGWSEAQLRKMFVGAVKERATKENPRVVQAKILREQDKYDATGARKSKGLGFVEFESHEHALVALRQLNNNPGTAWGRDKRPMVEFAIDNVKVLKKIEHLRERSRARQEEQQQQQRPQGQGQEQEAEAEGDGAGNGEKKGKKASTKRKDRTSSKGGEGSEREADGAAAVANGGPAAGGKAAGGKAAKRAAKGDAGGGGGGSGGGGEGDEEGGTALSKRQRKRQRQKERIEQKKALLKEGGVKALVEAVEANKQQRQAGGTKAVAKVPQANGEQAAQQQQQQQKRQRQQQQRQQAPKQQQQQPQQQRKRRAEEDELDRIAEEGLAAAASKGGANAAKRRRRRDGGEEGEGGDRLDRLVAQYRAKLAGDKPAQNSNSKSKPKAAGAAKQGAGAKGGAAKGDPAVVVGRVQDQAAAGAAAARRAGQLRAE